MKNSHLNRTLFTVIHKLVSKALRYLKVPVIGMRSAWSVAVGSRDVLVGKKHVLKYCRCNFCNIVFSNITAINVGTLV